MIAFFIENTQIDYSKCFSIMHFLKSGEIFKLDSPVKILLINDYEIMSEIGYDFNLVYKKYSDAPNTVEITDNVRLSNIIENFTDRTSFCFYIKNMQNSDLVNLHYFELIRQYENNSYLFIESDNNDYFSISDFYQIESHLHKKSYSHRFFKDITSNTARRFALINNTSRYFLPLLRTDLKVYCILSKNVFDMFCFSSDRLLSFENEEQNESTISEESLVRNFCIKLISEINKRIKKKRPDFNWNKYKELLSHTSVLGLCYFLSYLHTILTNGTHNISTYEITNLLLQSEDFSVGTMQLFENALKHAKFGYFCYRIHHSINKGEYLKDSYNIDVCSDSSLLHLEVIISDYNETYDIPLKFIDNVKRRKTSEINSQNLKMLEKNLQLRDFFDPSDECKVFWKDYYANTSNIALHYGLNIFEQIVTSSHGRFILTSSSQAYLTSDKIYNRMVGKKEYSSYIPGTQYKILFPIKNAVLTQKSTGLKVQLDTEQLKNKWNQHTIRFISRESLEKDDIKDNDIPFNEFKSETPKYKEATVTKLLEILKDKVTGMNKNYIIIFDVKEFISPTQSEVFAKALICLLGNVKLEKIAIINASHQFMSTFIRIFSLLYYKRITCDFLSNSEIYLCGDFELQSHNNVEIIFKGKDINKSVLLSKQIADYKGEYSLELSLLENIAEKCEKSEEITNIVKIFPFDVLIQNNQHTLFQEKTTYDLNQNLQQYQFGCRLPDVHMRVGSKIHITKDFYEATLLFGIENYISRFAYLLAERISKNISDKYTEENIVLVGYETYSEILIIETQRLLKEIFGINTQYLIYNDSSKSNKFRSVQYTTDSHFGSSKFIIIVPIGSTLTTHDKISAELLREYSFVNTENIIANLCVVLIRDEAQNNSLTSVENLFWNSIDETTVVLKSNYDIGNENLVDYIVSVSNKWHKPDECACCFPKDLCEEKPILKVNKSSVIPMIMMGLTEDSKITPSSNHTRIPHGKISKLKKHLKYGHFERGDNHYEYYFNTDTLAKDISNTKEFNNWLEKIRKTLKPSQKSDEGSLQFDFIVAPQHSTNAEFVMQVNEKVFGNPASVLFLDVKREYRDNIKTKFSNLTQLYNNLIEYGRPATINFHYVDDTITTGETFSRTKSLVQSLFPDNATGCNGSVEVNVFSSVIILLGRCSSDTKYTYAPKGKFFDYFELKISSMRNYQDACVLCNKHDDYREISKLSATNSMKITFSIQAKKYHVTDYTKDDIFEQDEGYKRMFLTHEINNRLSKLSHRKNNDTAVSDVLAELIDYILSSKRRITYHNDYLCTLIHIISSPFMTFRKSVLSASFRLLIEIASFILFDDYRNNNSYLTNELKKHIVQLENSENICELEKLIRAVFDGLSHLGANFVMRAKTINAFFSYVEKHFKNNTRNELNVDWVNYYSQIIKQTLMFNKQDSRVLWLEKILKLGFEENVEDGIKTKLDDDPNIMQLKNILLLENNLILHDTLEETVHAIQNTILNNKTAIFTQINKEKVRQTDSRNLEYKGEDFVKISENTDTNLLLKILFNRTGELRCESTFNKILTKTVNAYFCEAFRKFSEVNDNFLETEQLLKMSVLYLLLIPNSSINGAREEHLMFYEILLKQIKSVLKAKKVQLFMTHNKVIDFICSSEGAKDQSNLDYEKFLQVIINNSSHPSIGETYYSSNLDPCLNVIKIDNNSLDDDCGLHNYDEVSGTAWYLVFEVDKDLPKENLLINARNLLVMRESLLLRFKKDYDNNLYAEFSELRKKVKKLTDDKAGGHTPFAELSEEFDYLYELAKKDCDCTNKLIANNMKLITDLLISKLYVCHINDEGYPKQIESRHNDMQYNLLDNYKHILLRTKDLELRKEDSSIIVPQISFHGVDWKKEFCFMKKSEFIWIAVFYALIMNSLRHGIANPLNDNGYFRQVKITVETDGNYIIVSNEYVEPSELDRKDGITFETICAFFEHYNFKLIKIENLEEKKYIVKIPLSRHKKEE